MLDAEEPVAVAVEFDSVAAVQAAVVLLAATAASTSSWAPLKGVMGSPHAAAVVLSSPP